MVPSWELHSWLSPSCSLLGLSWGIGKKENAACKAESSLIFYWKEKWWSRSLWHRAQRQGPQHEGKRQCSLDFPKTDMREIYKLWSTHLRKELELLMKTQGNEGEEKVQENITRDRDNNSSVSQLGESNLREARLQPVFSRCLLTYCGPGTSCGWLKNIFHHRSFVVKENKVENGWHQIVSMIYHFSLVTNNQRTPFREVRAKKDIWYESVIWGQSGKFL